MANAYNYDVIVIGAGISGMVSAVTANGLGKRVAVIEKRKVGGNCSNLTCIPSKTLIRLSHLSRDMARVDGLGLRKVSSSNLDTSKIMPHVRSIVQKAYEKDTPETFERIGIHVLSGIGSFVDRHHIKVNGRTLSAETFIIASGTLPLIPPIKGLDDIDFLTNETLYDLDDLPRSLIILGGGVDGLEYASAFGRLGVETTVVEMSTRLLPFADHEFVNTLLKTLRADGIRILSGSKAVGLQKKENGIALTFEQGQGRGGEVLADRVLVAIGRKPDLEELSLDNVQVARTARGIITDGTLRTTAPNIYACGDIVGPDQLASMAEYQGILAACNAVLPIKRRVDYRNNVYVIFTDPPLAYIGLTEEQAHKKHGHKLKVYRFDYANMRRALIDGVGVGMAKFLCDGRGRLVGAHILGEAAGEVIHEAQVIKALKKPLHKLYSVTHAYPTYAQALVGRASQLAFLDRMGNNPFVKIGLGLLPGLSNRLSLARDRLAETEQVISDSKTSELNMVVESESHLLRQISIKAVRIGDKACIVDLPPELTDHDEWPILQACAGNGSKEPRNIILNFSQVRQINGLGAVKLVRLYTRAKTKGIGLMAFGASGELRNIFAVTELDEVMGIYDSEADAVIAAGVSWNILQQKSAKRPARQRTTQTGQSRFLT